MRFRRSEVPAAAAALATTAGLFLLSCGKNDGLVQVVIQAGVPKARTEASDDPTAQSACDTRMMLRVGAGDMPPLFKGIGGTIDSTFTNASIGDAITISANAVTLDVKGGPDRVFSVAGSISGNSCGLGPNYKPVFGETRIANLDQGITVPVEVIVSQYSFNIATGVNTTMVMTSTNDQDTPFIVARVPALPDCTLSGSSMVGVEDPQGQFKMVRLSVPASSFAGQHAFYPLPPGRVYRLGYKDNVSNRCCYRLDVGYKPVPGLRLLDATPVRDDSFCPSGF